MEIWQIIIIPILTAILTFSAKPLETILYRKRMGATDALFVVSYIFEKYKGTLSDKQSVLYKSINEFLDRPNSLGSESKMAALAGQLKHIAGMTYSDSRALKKAMKKLDQRATEREREGNKG